MLYAKDASGLKVRASHRIQGWCPGCGAELLAKCGPILIHHWSHRARPECDPWWEETAWHRWWKDRFRPDQVEVTLGPHRADVLSQETVLELQHSSISSEEIEEREQFYTSSVGGLIWVIDAEPFKGNLRDVTPPEHNLAESVQMPPNVGFVATHEDGNVWQAICDCGAWRLGKPTGWSPCWKCGSVIQPKMTAAHFDLRTRRKLTFRWNNPRRSWERSTSPKYFDLGEGEMLWIHTLAMDEYLDGVRVVGTLITTNEFLLWQGGIPKGLLESWPAREKLQR